MSLMAMSLVGAGIILFALGLLHLSNEKNAALHELLDAEFERPTRDPEDISQLMERAGAFAERALGHRPTVGKMRFKLIQSGSPLKAGEFAAMTGLATIVITLLTLLMFKTPLALGLVVGVPLLAMNRLSSKARKRVAKLESQLPEVLQLISGSLDAGSSLLLGMELAGEEGEAPLSLEFARVVREASVGRPLLEALDAMADRIGSKDILWTVKAIRIQHQTGGKLADTLRVLADFMHARQEVRGEVRALSAEAKISGKILIGLPISIGLLLFAIRRPYVQPLLTTLPGKIMLVMAGIGLVIGHLWMKKMGEVEI